MWKAMTGSAGGLLLAMMACSEPTGSPPAPRMAAGGVQEKLTGGGQFVHPTLGTVQFSFTAIRHADGSVGGSFQQHQFDLDFAYKGDVTCFAIDRENQRAWVGGVLTHTNDPDPITEIGDDAWFRVLDTGDNAAEPDRSTFLGFEGGGGIITSEQYCQERIWAPDNARTWPVSGHLKIH